MTVQRNRFLVNKTNRCTEFQLYRYYYPTCFGQPFCPSSGVLNCTSALVHFMQLWPFAARSRMEPKCISCPWQYSSPEPSSPQSVTLQTTMHIHS